jgi:hypothetical protein
MTVCNGYLTRTPTCLRNPGLNVVHRVLQLHEMYPATRTGEELPIACGNCSYCLRLPAITRPISDGLILRILSYIEPGDVQNLNKVAEVRAIMPVVSVLRMKSRSVLLRKNDAGLEHF